MVESTDCRLSAVGAATALARFLRTRGNDTEAEQTGRRLPRPVPGWLNRDHSVLDENLASTPLRIAD
jgi:hypothetical protein